MAEISGFSNIITLLTGADAFSLLFPFLLAWMLYYAMIDKADIFEDTELDGAAPIMALVLAFFTARFLVIQPFYQSFFSVFFGKIVIGLAAFLGLYALLGMSGWNLQDDGVYKYGKWIGAMMAGAAFIWAGGFGPAIFGAEQAGNGILGATTSFLSFLVSSGAIWLIVIAGAMLAVMGLGNNDGGDPNPDPDDTTG